MNYLIICFTALAGSALTFFSGFGLGTILLPVFALFFPIESAVALTAVVHFLNNIIKLVLFAKHADKSIVLKFGIPSVIGALAGAYLLNLFSDMQPLHSYQLSSDGKIFHITYLKLFLSFLMIFFALFDLIPKLSQLSFDRKYLFFGGAVSGFFGGLSGHQGALRSAFLIRLSLSKEIYIATGVTVACMVDVSRLSVYAQHIKNFGDTINYHLLIAATLSAFAGVFIGSKLLKKITVTAIQYIVATMLIAIGILLGAGII